MSRAYVFEGLSSFDALEQKLSMSAMSAGITSSQVANDPPPPGPEPDPGTLPSDDPPIVYPPMPESGPVGPG
jgi:hypothetical protein